MSTTFQWLVERGQPEGEERAIWLEHSGKHPARDKCWTTNAWDAAMFPDREAAEDYIEREGLDARAVEHGFAAPENSQGRDALDVIDQPTHGKTALAAGADEPSNDPVRRFTSVIFEDGDLTVTARHDAIQIAVGPGHNFHAHDLEPERIALLQHALNKWIGEFTSNA